MELFRKSAGYRFLDVYLRVILLATLMLSGISSFAQYNYKGKQISEDKFNELYSSCSKSLFAYKETVIDLMDDEGNVKNFDGKSGMLSAAVAEAWKDKQQAFVMVDTVTKVSSESAIENPLSKIGAATPGKMKETKTMTVSKPYFVIKMLPEDFGEKFNAPILVLDKVKEGFDKRLAPEDKLAVRLLPVTKEQFAKYLADGNTIYKINKIEAVYDKCPKCQGSGKVKNPNYKLGKTDPKQQYIPCENCKGTGKIVKTPSKAEKTEITLN